MDLVASELDVLLGRIGDDALRADIHAQIERLRSKKRFGLVFEDHVPERVRLPHHPVRRGVSVVKRAETVNETAFLVENVSGGKATLALEQGGTELVAVEDLVVVAEFGDPIYPGLKQVGQVHSGRGPFHVVINAENHHALEALQFTHTGAVDCVYIDPPYNTGARDWKYDNRYVDENDGYRHSKWLAFMERRLRLAKLLLNPDSSVLIVTIDEKEYLRLGLLLEQIFSTARIQMVSAQINPANSARPGGFARNDEYLFFVMLGSAGPERLPLAREWVSAKGRTFTGKIRWDLLRRSGTGVRREDSPGGFYPIYVDPDGPRFHSIGEPLPKGVSDPPVVEGAVSVLPIRKDGSEGRWQVSPKVLRNYMKEGRVRIGGSVDTGFVIYYLKPGEFAKIQKGEYEVSGRNPDGSLIVGTTESNEVLTVPPTQWHVASHDATQYGSRLLASFLPGRKFPFPKSLYAVEDALRFFIASKPEAVVVDFFAGSGTTAHAVMRLNRQDGGSRRSIMITNNEVSAEEAAELREAGLSPGDPEWEAQGIYEFITRPRLEAAVTGKTPDGEPIAGEYKFIDEFPISEGFTENLAFFELMYLDPDDVELDLAFESVAPLLWIRAGSQGPLIASRVNDEGKLLPYATTPRYGVLFDTDRWRSFVNDLDSSVSTVFVVTDSPTVFTGIVAELPAGVEAVRLYENYLATFAINYRRP